MNEMTMNGTSMYEEVAEVYNLNKVEGFDPRKFMRLIQKEGQPGKFYLDVAYRKLWFRLRYPEGKIVKKLIKLTDQVAIVEARVYLNRNDAEDNFISNALAQKYQTNDEQFGSKYVELAETAAVGRALSDAGFGLQFADKEEDFDPEVTEAPIEQQIMRGGAMLQQENYMMEETAEDGTVLEASEDDNIPGQFGIEEYIPMPNEVGAAMQQGLTPAMAQTPAMQQSMSQPAQPAPVRNNSMGNAPAVNRGTNAQAASGAVEIKKDMPVEQIYSLLTREKAASVVVPVGFNKGKTLGQVALEKPESLDWYVSSYGGPDNLLRAAAKFLMDAALAQAS